MHTIRTDMHYAWKLSSVIHIRDTLNALLELYIIYLLRSNKKEKKDPCLKFFMDKPLMKN